MIPSSWIPEFGETADLLLSSRAMLEPILEEGSEDEGENGLDELWSHYESVWSSESDTGSVIRVDLAQDQDCSSEREFACPPKRPRKTEFDLLDENPPIRYQPQRSPIISRHQTTFNIKQAIDNQPPLQRTLLAPPKLFDDFFQYSDSDSLSYQSLSRSSSLVQFESLEKQLQNDNNSMFGSSPSLYSQVSVDTKVNKLNIINENIVITSDHDRDSGDRVIVSSETGNKNKINSIESLSEDSGYNELQNFIKFKSKSIPVIYTYEDGDQVDGRTTQLHPPYDHFEHTKSLENFLYIEKNINLNEKLRISTSSSSSHSASPPPSSSDENIVGTKRDDYGRKNNHHQHRRNHDTFSSLYVTKNTNKISNETKNKKKFQNQNQKLVEAKIFYSYSPIFHKKCGIIFSKNSNNINNSDNNSFSDSRDRDLFQISSLPNNLNSLCALGSSGGDDDDNGDNNRSNTDSDDDFCAYRDTNRSSEINSFSGSVNSNSFKPSLTMSYANLTLINDDEEEDDARDVAAYKKNNKFFKYSNFNHNLSIINDKCDSDYDKIEDIVMDEKPIPPPRRTKSREALNLSNSNLSHSNSKLTFDQDPTSLATSYTSSLEKCNFNILESITTINLNDSNDSLLDHNYGGVKRKKAFVSSTPNLHYYGTVECRDGRDGHDFKNSKKDDFKSMRQIDNEIKPIGIMVQKNGTAYQSTGSSSKGNLTKGVSFCPIVSEISWKDVHQKSISIEEYINEIDSQLHGHINSGAAPVVENPITPTKAPQQQQQDLNKIEIDRPEIENDFVDEHDHNPYHDKHIQLHDPNIELNLFDTKNLTLSTMLALGNRHMFNSCNNNNGRILYDDDHHEKHMNKIIEILDRIDDEDRESIKNFDMYGGDESVEHNNNNNNNSNSNNSNLSSNQNNRNVNDKLKRDSDINKKQITTIVDDDHMVGVVTTTSTTAASIEENKKQTTSKNRSAEGNNSINSIAGECSNDRRGGNNNNNLISKDRVAVTTASESESKGLVVGKASNKKEKKSSKKSSKKMDANAVDKKAAKSANGGSGGGGGGFLSRFSSFRFSLGRNKNKVKNKINNNNINNNSNNSNFIINNNNNSNKNNEINNKIVHVPLKQQQLQQQQQQESDFINKNFNKMTIGHNNHHHHHNNNNNSTGILSSSASDDAPTTDKDEFDHCGSVGVVANNDLLMLNSKNINENFIMNEKLNNNSHVLISKPPLPKLPPRVVGVSTKKNNLTHAQYLNQNINTNNNSNSNNNNNNASSNNSNNNNNTTSSNLYYHEHQPQNIISHRSLSIPHVSDDNDNTSIMSEKYIRNSNNKIGLLETDLDTHETIITGKTRSLMELLPNNNNNNIGGGSGIGGGSSCVITTKNHLNKNLISASGPNGELMIVNNKNNSDGVAMQSRRPHKSMEFLLDKENHKNILPPENELQKSHESNTLSEHQLRVQASLQRLNIPDWFKQYSSNTSTPTSTQYQQHHHHHHHHHHHQHGGGGSSGSGAGDAGGGGGGYTGNFYRKRNSDVGGQPNRWTGLNSKTTSLSSLGSHRSDKSPLMLSPSAHSHHGQTGFSRWSTSHLNSTQTSPSISTRGSFVRGNLNASTVSGNSNTSSNTTNSSIRNSFRQPYLGWRSQEKLSQPRTPAERLASSLLTKQQEQQQQERERQQRASAESQTSENQKHQEEIQSSIKEVTSAIVHYVNDQTNRQTVSRSRSASPNSRKCWLESSFVGNRPLESPQTPVMDNSIHEGNHLEGSGKYSRGVSPIPAFSIQPERPSPGSATLEDVLASLLGLPLDSHRSSENIANDNFNYTNYNHNENMSSTSRLNVDQQTSIRRRSEGDAQQQQKAAHQHHHHHHTCNNHGKSPRTNQQSGSISSTSSSLVNQPLVVVPRRISLDSCEHTIKQQQQQQQKQQMHIQQHQMQTQQYVQTSHGDYLMKCRYPKCDAVANAAEAKKFYKSCHNCSNLYCSRECRRAHWEKHRKACLHSRVSSLCRQVLSTCKDDADSLRHLSLIARKGYLSQGRGVVRILFRSPENADSFIKQGFQCIGEAGYVRWADLLPSEMGPELYSELLRLSTEYKPDSKMLVYVAICVVSEAPGSGAAPVKWERQLVSRCAKLKLCRTILANEQLNATNHLTNEQQIQQQSTDVLILTFSTVKKSQKARELISRNIQAILKERGINLRKNFPEVFQRLNSYVDGLTERFLPVTIHPRDNQTGKSFICIIMPNNLDNGSNIKMPASDNGNSVQTIDVSLENLVAASSMLS